MELKFANPHSANVAIVYERGSSVLCIDPSLWNATNSLVTKRRPSKLAMAGQSCHGIPISQATGEKIQPKICSTLDGNQTKPCEASALWNRAKHPSTR